jgi:hypothetical protein
MLAFSKAQKYDADAECEALQYAGHEFEMRVRPQDCATRLQSMLQSRRMAETCICQVICVLRKS